MVLETSKIMAEQSISINFNPVSNFNDVTKAWLYKQSEVRELIQQARGTTNHLLMSDQAIPVGT